MNATTIRWTLTGPGAPFRLSLLALALVSSQAATAADDGWYAGLSLGESHVNIDESRIIARLLNDGFTSASLRENDKDFSYKVLGGYQFNRHFAMEGGYFNLGRFGYNAEMEPTASTRGDTRMKGLNLDLVGILPISESFSVFGRAGAIYGQTRTRFFGQGPVTVDPSRASEREVSHKYGVGLQYNLSPSVTMRIEAERYRMDDAIDRTGDIDVFTVGAVYRFARQAPVAVVAPSTPPRAVAAEPPAPATPPLMQVSFSTDSLFEFDRSVITPAGRAELDALIVDLRNVNFDDIRVTGHTDRIGTPAYNQTLSNARAAAVKEYLVRTPNISDSQVTTRGVGSTQPVTTPAQCSNQLGRNQLIACLTPDRRVTVEVNGTRPQ